MSDIPRVTREEFEKITCNRCGDCCEGFYLNDSIFNPDMVWVDGDKTKNWLQHVHLIERIDTDDYKGGKYYCDIFKREDDGTGTCTDHENRCHVCSNFPYGKPVDGQYFPRCSWNVILIDPTEIEH